MYPELVMKLRGKPSILTGKNSFARRKQRDEFIQFVASVFQETGRPFVPQQMNEGSTDLEWIVDSGNDWWVFFVRDDKQRVRIRHRYDNMERLIPLGHQLAERFDMVVLTPEYQEALPETM